MNMRLGVFFVMRCLHVFPSKDIRRVIDVFGCLRFDVLCVRLASPRCEDTAPFQSKLSTWAKSLLAGAVQHEYFESATLIHRLLERIGEAVAMRIHTIELRCAGISSPNPKPAARSYLGNPCAWLSHRGFELRFPFFMRFRV